MSGAASLATTEFAKRGFTPLASVLESARATDLALRSPTASVCVVRCVEQVSEDDHIALATMLAQGDFTRAAIVYTDEDQPHLTGEIEAYPLSRIDELAASLARERRNP